MKLRSLAADDKVKVWVYFILHGAALVKISFWL
jgi:hypothetical protein